MRLMNSPSTEVSDLVMTIHAIPTRGIRASKIESRSITGSQHLLEFSKRGLAIMALGRSHSAFSPRYGCALKVMSTVLLSLVASVTF